MKRLLTSTIRNVLVAITVCLFATTVTSGSKAQDPSRLEQEVIDLTNKERTKQGLPKLQVNAKLMKAARGYAETLGRLAPPRLSHEADGTTPGERVTATGYNWNWIGENAAEGQATAGDALTSWMNSPGHKANILSTDAKEIGVGIAARKDGRLYWVQVFGSSFDSPAEPKKEEVKPDVPQPKKEDKTGSILSGRLTTSSSFLESQKRYYIIHTMSMNKDTEYQMELSGDLKALVIINDASGKTVGSNLNERGNPLNRFTFRPTTSAEFNIIVTSQEERGTGNYQLSVR